MRLFRRVGQSEVLQADAGVGAGAASAPSFARPAARPPLAGWFSNSPLLSGLAVKFVQLAFLAGVYGLLEWITWAEILKPTVMPRPHDVLQTFGESIRSEYVTDNLRVTFRRLGYSFGIAASLGLLTGVVLWRLPLLGKALEPLMASLYAVPWIFFYPLLLILLGIGDKPIILLAVVLGFVPVALNTFVGFREIRPIMLKVGRATGSSPLHTFYKIMMPSAAPYVVAGLKLGFIYTFLSVIATEFLVSADGLGYIVRFAYEFFQVREMYAYVLFIIVLAFILTWLLDRVERALRGRYQ
ncbi:MAG TPA: ABC transporter permease [Dehalococcoidia bacterium]|nr:ABC transporter permease [Dehalococcoidia bacterium]